MKEQQDYRYTFAATLAGGSGASVFLIRIPKNVRIDHIHSSSDFPAGGSCLLQERTPTPTLWGGRTLVTLITSGATTGSSAISRKMLDTISYTLIPNGTDDTTFIIDMFGTRYQ